jgi:hypothetical protein
MPPFLFAGVRQSAFGLQCAGGTSPRASCHSTEVIALSPNGGSMGSLEPAGQLSPCETRRLAARVWGGSPQARRHRHLEQGGVMGFASAFALRATADKPLYPSHGCPPGKSLISVQPRPQKYSASHFPQITLRTLAVPAHRGAFRDRHGRWAGDAVDASGATDESADLRTVKSCGPDAAMLASSS